MESIAVFGIGSTNFRYAVGTPTGEFRTDIMVEQTDPQRLASQLSQAIATLTQETATTLDAVSISTTGFVDHANGRLREFDTKTGTTIHDIELRATIRDEFDLPVFLENDCNAAALGEWYYGDGDGYDCVAHVTFGTGIGAGIVERDRLLRGESGEAAEVGLFPVAPDTDLESFGVRGAWEAVCSGRGIPDYLRYRLRTDDRDTLLDEYDIRTAQSLFEAVGQGDRVATEYLDQISRYNAAGIGMLCNAYNPGLVTIGGGVALNNPQAILDGIRTSLDEYLFVEPPELTLTELGDDIGLYGAMACHRR